MRSRRILDTIDTSSIMINWSYDNDDRSLSLSCGTFLPNRPTGIFSAE